MVRQLAAVVAAVCVAGACSAGSHRGAGAGGAAASCVGPQLSIAPATAHAGDIVEASGEWFAADCYDTGQTATSPPLRGLTIQLAQGARTWTLASGVAADGAHYTFHVPVRLPDELRPGQAQVAVIGHGAAAGLHVAPR